LILYLDTSALVKSYIREAGSLDVKNWIDQADHLGSSAIAFVELASTLTKIARLGFILPAEAQSEWKRFQQDWLSFKQIVVSESVIQQAGLLAWQYPLRGYDAIHLSAALTLQQTVGEWVTLATFDRLLWQAAKQTGLGVLPEVLV